MTVELDHIQRPSSSAIGQKEGRIATGDLLPPRSFKTVSGKDVHVPDQANLTHMQFRRFAGCPVCTMHLRAVAKQHDEIRAAGIVELVFYYSAPDEIRQHVGHLPFEFVADPERHVYLAFGVHAAPRALADPRAWGPIARAVTQSLVAIMRGHPMPPLNPRGGRFGLPADFLIGSDGRVIASKYGVHVNDQWSVEHLLDLARRYRTSQAIQNRQQREEAS